MSDAAHLLSDVAGFAVSLMALHIASMKSPTMTYGYARAEVLGALLSVITIWMVTGMLVTEAIQRIINPQDVDGRYEEHGHHHSEGNDEGHDHDHDHNHDHDLQNGDQERVGGSNMNVRSAWLHAIGDLLQNIGVMIAAALIWWKPEWRIADPIATLLFSGLVIWTTKVPNNLPANGADQALIRISDA
eukprot:scaffold93738_cov42-Prasinocladus_malaysianus.AAC.2